MYGVCTWYVMEWIVFRTYDSKYHRAAQTDRSLMQDLVRDYDRLAVSTQIKYIPTFIHGDHRSRIDFALIHRIQIR